MDNCISHRRWPGEFARAMARVHTYVLAFVAAWCTLMGQAAWAQTTTTTTLTVNLNPVYVSQSVTLTATVTGSSPTGTVSFKDGATTLATVTLNTNGMASWSPSFTNTGVHNLTATYNGNTSNATSTSAVLDLTVNPKLDSTTALSVNLNPVYVSQSVTLTATVTGSSPTGTVSFKDGATTLATVTLNTNGVASWSPSFTTTGVHNLTATYNGNTSNAASTSAALDLTVNPKLDSTTALSANLNPVYVSQSVTLTATVTGSSPTGTVSFKDGATTLATVTLNTNGVASWSPSFTTTGVHNLTATYNGNTSNATSTSPVQALTVNPKLQTSTALVVSPNPINITQSVTLTATVSGSTPTGTVTFYDGASSITTLTLSSGTASTTRTFSTTGTHNLSAVYTGDTSNATSTSAAVGLPVNPAPTTTTLSCPASTPVMSGISCAVTVTAPTNMSVIVGQPVNIVNNGATVASGTLAQVSGSTGVYSATVALSGSAPPLSAVGTYTLLAQYPGTATTAASTSANVTVDVQRPAVGASTPPVVNYEYDAQGNPTKTVQAPASLALATTSTYDALNRRKDTTDARAGKTQFAYDGQDHLTQVTDPRNLVTQYPRNGLGQATQLISPDTGTASHTYDEAGNLKTRTDARGVLATYSYDVLNRLTQLTYSQGGQNQTLSWQYDLAGVPNSIGRLGQATHGQGSIAYRYDAFGRMISKTQQVNAATGANATTLTHTVGYEYDNVGRITAITYPSGAKLVLTYTNGQLSALALAKDAGSAAAPLVSQIQWQPFGPVKAWQWEMAGGPQLHERSYDTSGRLVRYRLGGVLRDLTYDAADRITSYQHQDAASAAALPELDQFFGYDALGRLTGINTATASWTIGYDANGNRTSVTLNGSTSSYTTPSTSNRLQSVSNPARSFGYDASGNTTADGNYTSTYDLAGRLATLTKAGVTTNYAYDNHGQRVRKFSSTGASSTVIFVHDQDGQLLGEYDSAGQVIREYVWLGSTPVAVFMPDAASPGGVPIAYFIHADHIDTPRVVVDRSNNVRWRWLAEPFGATAAETDPSGFGAFAFNLRFPGQYLDQESGLHYNYFRDYDASIGRYVESDPIGLAGGINTYGYVEGNPVSKVDPTGEFGIAGAIGAAGFNFGTQFLTNLYLTDGDWRRALKCVDFGDVAVSGALGFVGPSFLSNVLGGKAGPAGLTAAQNRFIYLTQSLPAGFFLKKGTPPLRSGDDCECKGLTLGNLLGAFAH
jgi:RHS repeat-associated protein